MDSSLVHGRLLDDDFVPLQQFFTVLEHIFLFALKGWKYFIGFFMALVERKF